uniref:Intraflagellar transport protein n=1 Tax=Ascaris lumbricoides TaxID=6252 RepID=A0A0M3ITS9_ASCLU
MRSLLKSGDTEKIIFFAKKAHNKEIYILAANFLQTLNWKTDTNLMKYIETFYTKANAYELLASFYEACAQVEIDDYRDYSKANAALAEAQRCIKRALEDEPKNVIQLSEKLDELSHTIANIKKFVGIRTIYETDPNDAIRQLQALADEKGIDESIRIGDIYAIMIIHNARKSNFKKAYSLICQLQERQPRINVSRYVNAQILDTICDELHHPRLTGINNGASDEEDDTEEGVEYSHALKRQIQNKSSFAGSDLHKALNS